jgi:hypothetical protein
MTIVLSKRQIVLSILRTKSNERTGTCRVTRVVLNYAMETLSGEAHVEQKAYRRFGDGTRVRARAGRDRLW